MTVHLLKTKLNIVLNGKYTLKGCTNYNRGQQQLQRDNYDVVYAG